MAREGYTEAKHRRAQAAAQVLACETAVSDVEMLKCIPELKELHRSDKQRNLETAQAELAAAETALEAFAVKKASASMQPDSGFRVRLHLHLSLTAEMHLAMENRCQADGIGAPELVRQALASYLKANNNAQE